MGIFFCQTGTRKMTHQRKMMLKSLMLNKAREDLKRETEQKAEEKKSALAKRIEPMVDMDSLSAQELMVATVNQLYSDIYVLIYS